jgi:hypothetical protein
VCPVGTRCVIDPPRSPGNPTNCARTRCAPTGPVSNCPPLVQCPVCPVGQFCLVLAQTPFECARAVCAIRS